MTIKEFRSDDYPGLAMNRAHAEEFLARLNRLIILANGGSAAITDHNALENLTEGDPHTQYILVSGARSFTAPVGGVAPVTAEDLATKAYVDSEVESGGVHNFTTDEVTEGTENLYYTNARATAVAVPQTSVGVANGVAELDAGGRVPSSQLPQALIGALHFVSTYDASTNTPDLSQAAQRVNGAMYLVHSAGTQNINGDGDVELNSRDALVYQTITNEYVHLPGRNVNIPVLSVQGRTGNVVLALGDLNSTSLETLNTLIIDGTLDTTSDRRLPRGNLTGDVVGNLAAGPISVVRLDGVPIDIASDSQANRVLATNNVNSRYEQSTFVRGIGNLTGNISPADLADLLRPLITPSALFNLVTDAPAQIDVPANLSGTVYSLSYDVDNAGSVGAIQILGQRSGLPAAILNSAAPHVSGTNTVSVTVPANTTLDGAGDTYTLSVVGYHTGDTPGSSTPFTTLTHIILGRTAIAPPPRTDVFYIGWVPISTTADNVDLSQLTAQSMLSGDFTIPTSALSGARLIFAYPSTVADISSLVITGREQISFYNNTPAALTSGGVQYDVVRSANPLIVADTAGQTVTVVR